MKRIIALVCALILMMAVAAPIASADVWKTAYVKTNSGVGLNAREAPSTSAKIIITIPYGAEVTITGYSNNKSWASIRYDGGNAGYVSTRYLVSSNPGPYKPTAKPTAKPTVKPTATTNPGTTVSFSTFKHVEPYAAVVYTSTPTGTVHLRWAPGTAHASMGICVQGTEITVLAEGKGWCQVRVENNGYVGFMSSKFIVKSGF